jgi:hypothetical protein
LYVATRCRLINFAWQDKADNRIHIPDHIPHELAARIVLTHTSRGDVSTFR